MNLADLQTSIRVALLDGETSVPASEGWPVSLRLERRYAVHRNTFLHGLSEVLLSRFPVSARITGAEFFSEMARQFVLRSPPRSPVLQDYGDDLPEFVAGFGPALELPYLADVLRLEIAWSQAYHAADASPAGPGALAALDVETIDRVRVKLHPSLRLLRSAYPIVTIWAMNQDGAEPRAVVDWSGEDALVRRPDLEVDLARLPPGGFDFLDALRRGRTLGEALEDSLAASDGFDPAPALAGLVSAGLVLRFTQERAGDGACS